MKFLIALTLSLATTVTLAADPKSLCLAEIKRTLKDPDSAKVESFLKWSQVETDDGEVAVRYTLTVNAKNSFGGYTGGKPYDCQVSVDGKRVLKLTRF